MHQTKLSSRRFILPRSRRLTTDVLHFSRKVPLCPHDRVCDLSLLRDLRSQMPVRISWSLLFIKAFALVAQQRPVLRQLYFSYPWATVYEHPFSVAMLAVHRDFRDEPWLFWGRFVQPETKSLSELQAALVRYQTEHVERIFRQQLRLSGLPTALRRTLWWWNLNVSGKARARRTGTCFLSTLAGQGAEIQSPPAFLTSNMTYGPLNEDGRCRVTISYDHRLMDGHVVASALHDLEQMLHTQIVDELRHLGQTSPGDTSRAA